MLTALFVADGKLRPFWRAVIFFVAAAWVVQPLVDLIDPVFESVFHPAPGLSAGSVALNELKDLVIALICTAAFAAYEHRRIDSYGLPVKEALGARTWEGAACGFIMAALVALGMLASGAMKVHGVATNGTALMLSAFAWFGTNLLVGLAEEFWYRSYFLQTLWKSLGFWPAAIVIGLLFTADHYFYKPGENVWDAITLMSLSLVMSYSVLRTATLWFAVGFHFAFDYMQLFVIGTPNGSKIPVGRLLNVTFEGPAWLSGGVLGTEASFLMYPVIALLWVWIWWRFRNRPALNPG